MLAFLINFWPLRRFLSFSNLVFLLFCSFSKIGCRHSGHFSEKTPNEVKCQNVTPFLQLFRQQTSLQWSSSSLESYLSMFFFLLSRAAGWALEKEKCETKGLFIPQGGNVHRFVTQCYILSIKIFPTSKMTSCHKEPQHNGNLEEQNSIWLQLHYLVTNSFVFWWKLR